MDEAQLRGRSLGEDERIQIGEPHASIEAVQRVGERKPGRDEVVEVVEVQPSRSHIGKGGAGRRLRLEREAVGTSSLERIDDVKVVSEGFGPILPRMHRRVGTHEAVSPVGRRPFLVMPLLRRGIVGGLVAEERPKRFDATPILDQLVPVVVADFMPEMPQQRAIGFTHLLACLLTKGIIGLGDIDGDEPLTVPGEDALPWRAALERKRQSLLCVG